MKKLLFFVFVPALAGLTLGAQVCAAQTWWNGDTEGWGNDAPPPPQQEQPQRQKYHGNGLADPWDITSVTFNGGPILTHHFQSGHNNFVDHHTLAMVQAGTRSHGNWGVYLLTPNSEGRTSVGAGYITDPYSIPLGQMTLELSAGIGAVTGYDLFPIVPMLSGNMRLAVYQSGPWNAGVQMSALPYIAEDPVTGNNKFGVVATTPYLSIRYQY